MSESFVVSLCKELLFIGKGNLTKSVRDLFLLQSNPHSFRKRAYLVCHEYNLVIHKKIYSELSEN